MTTVTTVQATDRDSVVFQYTFLSGNDEGRFVIGPFTGIIQTVGSLDRETTAVYNLVIQADDNVGTPIGNTGTTQLRITLLDINDEAPQFQPPGQDYIASINENSPEGTLVLPDGGIRAVDGDEPGTLNSLVQYRLEGTNAPKFNIDSSRGIVSVARGMTSQHYVGID